MSTAKVNALGNPMKAYNIQKFYGGILVNGDLDITLHDLLGKTDFDAAEIDAMADLEVGETPLKVDVENDTDGYLVITRIR